MMGWTQVSGARDAASPGKAAADPRQQLGPDRIVMVLALRLCLPRMLDWEIDSKANPPTVERVWGCGQPQDEG